jgi:hypothetical protein
MNHDELDKKFDDNEEDVLHYFDLTTARRPGQDADEQIIEGIKEGLSQATNGETIPLSQMWDGVFNQQGEEE